MWAILQLETQPLEVLPDPKARFVQAVLDDIATRPQARDEVLAHILYYQQSLWEQLGQFQMMLNSEDMPGPMKMMMKAMGFAK